MYSILIDDDNNMIVSKKERIIQRSKLVDNLRIYFKDTYKELDMSEFTAYIEYVLPTSKKYRSEKLEIEESETNEGYLEGILPLDTKLTAEAGDIEIQVSFVKVEMDTSGNTTQYVRKTSPCDITIIPVAAWSDLIPDDILTPLDQAFVQMEAKIQQLDDLAQTINDDKADDIAVGTINNTRCLYLKSQGEKIGTPISINDLGNEIADDTEAGMINVITI